MLPVLDNLDIAQDDLQFKDLVFSTFLMKY